MPFSPALWFAAGLLWILDAANNVTMEPYRAYVSDRLRPEQHASGFLTQSVVHRASRRRWPTSTPSLLVWLRHEQGRAGRQRHPGRHDAGLRVVGALLSFTTVWWSIRKVPELPLPAEPNWPRLRGTSRMVSGRRSWRSGAALRDMPATMRRLWWMALFQWYGMMCYWIYIVPTLAATMFGTDRPAQRRLS